MPFWLNATRTPGEIAARAGNCVRVLPHAYTHCTGGREDLIGQQIEDTLDPDSSTSPYRGLLIGPFRTLFNSYYVGRVGLEPTTGGL